MATSTSFKNREFGLKPARRPAGKLAISMADKPSRKTAGKPAQLKAGKP